MVCFLTDSMYECICQLDYEYHALCLISALFLRNLCLFFQSHRRQAQRGAQTHASVTHHMVSCHTAGILHNGSKRLYLSTCVSPHVQCGRGRICRPKRPGHQALRDGRAMQKHKGEASGLSCSCDTCRTGICVSHRQIQIYVCIISE